MKHLPEATADWAVLMDVDGTLVEIADHPDNTQPSPRLSSILQHLSTALNGAVALISGREILAIDRLTGHTGLAAAGLHGLEMRAADGRSLQTAAQSSDMVAARERLQNLVAASPGLYLEDKTATLAVHYRSAPAEADEAIRVGTEIADASDGQLELLHGKAVFELKPVGADKGSAVRAFMKHPPFAGCRPVYVGDDVTDEDAFAAVNDMGGISIHVGNESNTAATHTLATVEEVLEWLNQIAATVESRNSRAT